MCHMEAQFLETGKNTIRSPGTRRVLLIVSRWNIPILRIQMHCFVKPQSCSWWINYTFIRRWEIFKFMFTGLC